MFFSFFTLFSSYNKVIQARSISTTSIYYARPQSPTSSDVPIFSKISDVSGDRSIPKLLARFFVF